MVLIISEVHDVSTKHVIDWLCHRNVPYIVIHDEDFILKCSLYIRNGEIDFIADLGNDKRLLLSDIKTFWYRRGFINKMLPRLTGELMRAQKEEHLLNEWTRLQALIHTIIERKPGVGRFEKSIYFNKAKQLIAAGEAGLQFPDTLISNNIDDLLKFKDIHGLVITKSIERDFDERTDKLKMNTKGTSVIDKEHIHKLDGGHSLPSLVQKGINKKYELRIFFLDGNFWSMCIFHNSSYSEVDYRRAGRLRMVPYKLPIVIEEKLTLLMANIGLNCGSIDMLVDHNDEFYFLEVNPVGQYDFVSVRCNYYLDRVIADFLINQM